MSEIAALTLRPYCPADREKVLLLLHGALGWASNDLHARFFDWKHWANPAGPSPALVAEDEGEVVGFRALLRWDFEGPDGARIKAVRAVDTATHPAHQGRGIFSALTRRALGELTERGVSFVFNTPNDKSRPGYLKMGWTVVGRLPVWVHTGRPSGAYRLLRARIPAEKWSTPTAAGVAAPGAFADRAALERLLESRSAPAALRTRLTAEHLAWRYGFEDLQYRVVMLGDDLSRGAAVFRLRRRGPALEAAVCELLTADEDRRGRRRLVREVLRVSGADYAIGIGGSLADHGSAPLPHQGPILLRRQVGGFTGPALSLGLGDVELF